MTTGTVIIERALEKIGVHSIVAPATPDTIILGKEELNDMLEMWLSDGIQIGFTPLDVPADNLNEANGTKSAIINNLAINLAPSFDNGKSIVSADLKALASSGFRKVQTKFRKFTIPPMVPSSTLPRGQGNTNDFFRQPFFGQNAEID